MTATQNVTLAILRDILRKAKILAAQRNTSLSGLLAQTLIEIVALGSVCAGAAAQSGSTERQL